MVSRSEGGRGRASGAGQRGGGAQRNRRKHTKRPKAKSATKQASVPLCKVPYSVVAGELVPHYLTERDHPWLRSLLDEFDAFVDRPRRDLEVHLRGCRFRQLATARDQVTLASHVVFQLVGTKIADDSLPPETRLDLFELAAEMEPPELALTEIAERLGLTPTDVAQALFADLAEERLIQAVPPDLHPAAVALAANLALAQALVRRATFVEVRVAQRSRALVRMINLWGLLYVVKEFSKERGTVLEITGALARLRTTTRYGHAMGRLLPLLPWCGAFGTEPGSVPNDIGDFRLRARCRLGNQDLWFQVRASDPLPAAAEPRAFDSKIEERFAKEFRRAAPHLELIREPEPIPIDGGFVFPDFRIQDPGDPNHSCLVEIIGYWTEDYLRKKLAALRSLATAASDEPHGGEPWILCVDEQRRYVGCNCPQNMQIVWYQRRIDPERVLQAWLAAERLD